MKVPNWFALPLAVFALTACTDQTTAPDLDLELTAAFKKPPKPPKPPPPTAEPANPVIAYAAGSSGNRTLWVVDADGGHATEIYTGTYRMHSSWSDQGNGSFEQPYVILVSRTAAEQPLVRLELFLDQGVPTVKNVLTLNDENRYYQAVVRPGGAEFVAVEETGEGLTKLVLGNMQTGEVAPLYQAEAGKGVLQPAWSRDGTTVAFFEEQLQVDLNVDVRILDLTVALEDEDRVQTAFSFDGFPRHLSWSRTSATNELLLDVDGMMYRVDLNEPVPTLGDSIGEGGWAAWSPDDTKIVYEGRGLLVKTFGKRKDKRLPGGGMPDWRRNPLR